MKFENICIVGGGTAGWMTASMLKKHFGNRKKINLIESPKISSIGVGESTTQWFLGFIRYLGLVDSEWMPACDATYKHSVRFVNFNKNGPFHYPFSEKVVDLPLTDYFNWRKDQTYVGPETFGRVYTDISQIAEEGKIEESILQSNVGYHIDAVKFAQYLKNWCGVECIEDTICRIDVNDDGIEALYGESGKKYESDLFIDCTGFRALLLENVNAAWESWSDIMFNNCSWVCRRDYENKERELVPYTNCTGLSSGWVWNVPTYSRIGTGYNYSSNHQSIGDALEEFQKFIGADERTKFKHIQWKTGVRKEIWKKNVCGIGLSAGFIEPLESGSLYSVHEFLWKLIQVLPKDAEHYNQHLISSFNLACRTRFQTFRDFVVKHYTLSNRDDTKFWKDYTNLDYIGDYSNLFTLDWEEFQQLNGMPEGIAFLLGGYQYNMCPDLFTQRSIENNYAINDPSDIINERLDRTYPNEMAIDYYRRTLYKEED